jgi:hypothetical protein
VKEKFRKLLTPILVICVVGVAMFLLSHQKHDDRAEIEASLKSALKASREGRAGGVMEYLTSHVVVNGVHYNVDRQFSNFIRRYHPDITLGAVAPVIKGDNATVTSDIQFSVLTNSIDIPNVTFTLHREDTRKWLLFPDQEWKVTGATAPEEQYQQILDQLQFAGGTSIF